MDGYHHHHHHGGGGGGGGGFIAPGYGPPGARHDGGLPPQPTVKIFCKANENYSLSVRDGHVVLASANPNDDYQHWIKDMRHSTSVKDEEGYPAFALINKVTGQALKHSLGQSHPVRAVPYNPQVLDESVLWTESRDVGHGFRCIRMVNNIYLNFDAFHGDKDHGGVHDGTSVVLWKWCEGDNQRWKIVPYCISTLLLSFLLSSNSFVVFSAVLHHIQIVCFLLSSSSLIIVIYGSFTAGTTWWRSCSDLSISINEWPTAMLLLLLCRIMSHLYGILLLFLFRPFFGLFWKHDEWREL